MKTDFFKNLNALGVKQLSLTVRFDQNEEQQTIVTVAMLPLSNVNDVAIDQIPPLTLTSTIPEMDEQFFELIQKPMKLTASLINNIETYSAQLEEAKRNSKLEKR